jgi:hypothetical protein
VLVLLQQKPLHFAMSFLAFAIFFLKQKKMIKKKHPPVQAAVCSKHPLVPTGESDAGPGARIFLAGRGAVFGAAGRGMLLAGGLGPAEIVSQSRDWICRNSFSKPGLGPAETVSLWSSR